MKIIEAHIQHNFNVGRTATIDMIVLHSTGADDIEGTLAWFNNPIAKASSHYVIDKDGTIYKTVNVKNTAWHTVGYNSRSIGIELVQSLQSRLTYAQKRALCELVFALLSSGENIKYLQGHYELSPVKKDPYEEKLVPSMRYITGLRNHVPTNK